MALRADKELGRCFQRVACAIRAHEAERIGVDFITQNTIGQGGGEVLGTDLEKLEGAYKHPAQTYPPLFPLPSTPPPPRARRRWVRAGVDPVGACESDAPCSGRIESAGLSAAGLVAGRVDPEADDDD
jgi:hypothetical protein